MVYGNPYLPSEKNNWKPPRRRKNDLWARFLYVVVVFLILFWAWTVANPAKAKEPEIKDCMTNQCICSKLLIEGFGDYKYRTEILKGCTSQ